MRRPSPLVTVSRRWLIAETLSRERGQGSGATVQDDHLHGLRVEEGLIAEFRLHLDAERARRQLGITAD